MDEHKEPQDLKQLMKDNYITYASYVISNRAIPNVTDGLKPVQRRILHTLLTMHNGKLHKVANVVGQTMAYHPHGDAPISEALVNLANKGYLLDLQGNFGNILTGDPPAASRYIETRLSDLAKETMFNPQLTNTIPSYDGRHLEPIVLPAKIPLLLMQGAEGIAVGMSTHILPHNFNELINAQIAILEKKEYLILPDFPTGGLMDASEYDKGRGKVKLRAKLEIRDPKTIAIVEICYGTTTESLIRSIDEAAKKGKVKIDAINDYTAEKVDIEIKLPRGVYAEEVVDALYAFTECQVSQSSMIVVIKDNYPWEPTINEILEHNTVQVKEYLKRELEIERDRLLEKIFEKTLEQIFIENRLYKVLETIKSMDVIHEKIAKSLEPYHDQLLRIPTHEDRERLLNIPIRRISRFDLDKNQEDIAAAEKNLSKVEKDLSQITKFTINYLKNLLKKYGEFFPRRTEIQVIENVDKRAIETKTVKIGFDPASGFIGTKVVSEKTFECTNFDKLLLFYQNGTYTVINIPEKKYVHQDGNKVVYAGVADKKTVVNVIYKDLSTNFCYAKKFVVTKFILDKTYPYFEDNMELQFFSTRVDPIVELQFIPKVGQKSNKKIFEFKEVRVKNPTANGIRCANRGIKKIVLMQE